ncbi:hypothetical protein GCM10010222_59940 [Streptomyces tanashiensis]|nr:hypothetical protein GCM10010222_59940 [Streptomyces tanashiensis]GGY51137.1 hypothetical protein GCM10010299_66530 [Streptomyces tanashiensis]
MDHWAAEPFASAGAEGTGTPEPSWPSEGADPGEVQPGVSFTVVHLGGMVAVPDRRTGSVTAADT